MDKHWIDGLVILSMLLLTGWINAQFGLVGADEESKIAGYYLLMGVVTFAILLAAYVKLGFFDFIGTVKPANEIIKDLGIGLVIGFALTQSFRELIQQLITTPGAISPQVGFLFVVIIAVFVETYFFWAAVYPSLKKFFGGNLQGTVIAAIVISLLFASWHIVAADGDFSRLQNEFLYSLLSVAAVQISGSILIGLGMHFGRNLATFNNFQFGG